MNCPYCDTNLDNGDCTQTAIFAADKAARIASLQASIAALGNDGKAERERLNVSEFLLNLGVPFTDADVISVPEGQDPPDVLFDPARFEIKELYDDGRRRGDEYKQLLREAEAATRCKELRPMTLYSPRDTTAAEVLALAIARGLKYSENYNKKRGPALVPTLDLLLYHNLVDVIGMHDETIPSTAPLVAQGWRSVSVLFGHRSIIFCATADAPPLLRGVAGTVRHRP